MKVSATWKDQNLRITHTLIVEAQNIEEAIEEVKTKYPDWELVSIRSKQR